MIKDQIQPFELKDLGVRGRLVRLESVTSDIIAKHGYPAPVAEVLSELLAAGAALSSLLKFDGVFTLQSKTDGPISMAVVDFTSSGHARGFIQYSEEEMAKSMDFAKLMGSGYLAFTVDQGMSIDRYQGIVELNHESLCAALTHYFEQSEQLKTKVIVRSERDGESWKSGALLLQQLPDKTESDKDVWHYMEALLSSLSKEEMLSSGLSDHEILYRLFNENECVVYEPKPLMAQCRCSKDRINAFLHTLSSEELDECVENNEINLTCEFCNARYTFRREDILNKN